MPGSSVLCVTVRQLIRGDLAQVAPGPELSGALAGIELSRLSTPGGVMSDEFAADEIRATLVLTRWVADAQFWLGSAEHSDDDSNNGDGHWSAPDGRPAIRRSLCVCPRPASAVSSTQTANKRRRRPR